MGDTTRPQARFPELALRAFLAVVVVPVVAAVGFAVALVVALVLVVAVPALLAAVPFVVLLVEGKPGSEARDGWVPSPRPATT